MVRRAPKRKPITEEQVREMMRMRRQGQSIKAIAQAIGCHRQTVRTHLKERHGDILADEARKQVLIDELRSHFQELANFAAVSLRRHLDASPAQMRDLRPEVPISSPISTAGMLGLPGPGLLEYVVDEWARMYEPSSRERHLTQALREHIKDSDLWIHLDSWRREVADYETASRQLLQWVVDKTEPERLQKIVPEHMERTQRWLFGNILCKTSGDKYQGENSQWLWDILSKAETLPQWTALERATGELREWEKQNKLKDIIYNMNSALDGIELMRAFPGRCHLCPV